MISGLMAARLCGLAAVAIALSLAPSVDAKDFKPGDVRVCVAATCLPLKNDAALDSLSAFYYSSAHHPKVVTAPRARAPYVELRYRNGYVTGIAAGARFDHFLSYGVNLGQFRARTWYAIPERARTAIASLAARLDPRPLPPSVLDNSH
jgi:hypothetical protein